MLISEPAAVTFQITFTIGGSSVKIKRIETNGNQGAEQFNHSQSGLISYIVNTLLNFQILKSGGILNIL